MRWESSMMKLRTIIFQQFRNGYTFYIDTRIKLHGLDKLFIFIRDEWLIDGKFSISVEHVTCKTFFFSFHGKPVGPTQSSCILGSRFIFLPRLSFRSLSINFHDVLRALHFIILLPTSADFRANTVSRACTLNSLLTPSYQRESLPELSWMNINRSLMNLMRR